MMGTVAKRLVLGVGVVWVVVTVTFLPALIISVLKITERRSARSRA